MDPQTYRSGWGLEDAHFASLEAVKESFREGLLDLIGLEGEAKVRIHGGEGRDQVGRRASTEFSSFNL
jgi:hypothetical protein